MSGAPASRGPVRIWLETAHHAAFRVGGWAFVRADGAEVTGAAGGDRRAEAERIALEGLIAALKDAPRPVRVITASPLIAAIPVRLRAAAAGENAPTENLAQWAQAQTALASGVEIVRGAPGGPGTPTTFAASWAELARDKAKTGPFRAAIPRGNLGKVDLS